MITRRFGGWSWHGLRGEGGAIFSPCERYRYVLWRDWREAWPAFGFGEAQRPNFVRLWKPLVAIALNPSTATERAEDPTVRTLLKLARREACNGLVVLNAFALRSTEPKALYATEDPIGPDNDRLIAEWVRGAALLLVAWGNHGALRGRGREIDATLRAAGYGPLCFGVTGKGEPRHPLYTPDDVRLLRWTRPGVAA